MVPPKATSSKESQVNIAVALLLLLVGVANAGLSVVPVVTDIAEVQTILIRQDVGLPYVGNMHTICKWQTDRPQFHFAKTAIANSSESPAGLRPGKYYCSHLSRRIEIKMHDEILTPLEKDILIGKKLGAFDDFVGQQLLKCISYGIQDKFIVSEIKNRVINSQRRIALSGCPFLPAKLHHGNFVIGYDLWNNKLLTDVQYCNAHTLIVAGTGAGKTNLSKCRVIQIAPLVRGMWLIDIRKKEYRFLRPIFARMGIDLKIVRGHKFCLNPLEVPYGVKPLEYTAVISDLLVKVLNLPPRASTLLKSTIIKLYHLCGILDGGDKFPTLFHLHKAIREDRDANPQARQATLDNLEAILLELGPEMLAYHRGWSVKELAKQYIVMEMSGLTEQGKDLVISTLLTQEFISRIERGISNPSMDLYIAVDEAQKLFCQHRDSSSYGGNALTDLVGLVRGTGIGLEISVLTTHNLSVGIPNLTATKIVGRCGSEAEYSTAGHFAALNNEQIEWFAHHSVPGLFAAQLGEGNHRYPFLFRIPLLNEFLDSDDFNREKCVSNNYADETTKNMPSVVKALPA
jgi:hypothetical protein